VALFIYVLMMNIERKHTLKIITSALFIIFGTFSAIKDISKLRKLNQQSI
jgi:hypothetical protein